MAKPEKIDKLEIVIGKQEQTTKERLGIPSSNDINIVTTLGEKDRKEIYDLVVSKIEQRKKQAKKTKKKTAKKSLKAEAEKALKNK